MSDSGFFDELREEYEGHGLDGDLPAAPGPLFDQWLAEAAGAAIPLSNAMALATATAAGPSVRMVLLKNVDDAGRLWFFTDYSSRKGADIEASDAVAALFYWEPLHRQIRVAGRAEKLTAADSDKYFASRPRTSQLSAMASHQSQILPGGRAEIEAARDALERDQGGRDLERPERWGGYAISPTSFEFWQGRANRLHQRLRYDLVGERAWDQHWLAP